MGFLISFNRKIYLMNYINSLESKINACTETKLSMTEEIANIGTQINDIGNPDSPAVKQLKAEKLRLEAMEKKMDIELQKYQTQLQAANTEMQSADQALQQGIQNSFSYKIGA